MVTRLLWNGNLNIQRENFENHIKTLRKVNFSSFFFFHFSKVKTKNLLNLLNLIWNRKKRRKIQVIDLQPMAMEVASRKMVQPKSKKCNLNLLMHQQKSKLLVL